MVLAAQLLWLNTDHAQTFWLTWFFGISIVFTIVFPICLALYGNEFDLEDEDFWMLARFVFFGCLFWPVIIPLAIAAGLLLGPMFLIYKTTNVIFK